MAQGEFTKQECEYIIETFSELFKAFSKPKMREFFGHANDIYLFLEAAKRAAPDKPETADEPKSV